MVTSNPGSRVNLKVNNSSLNRLYEGPIQKFPCLPIGNIPPTRLIKGRPIKEESNGPWKGDLWKMDIYQCINFWIHLAKQLVEALHTFKNFDLDESVCHVRLLGNPTRLANFRIDKGSRAVSHVIGYSVGAIYSTVTIYIPYER